MTDRLSIDKSINDTVIPAIDETKILGLDKSSSDRIELYLFAMALGVSKGVRTPLKAAHGFILESSAKSFDGAMSSIYSVFINELIASAEEDKISDKEYAYKVADEYAHTGFRIIGKWLSNQKESENIMWDLIMEMDSKFEELEGLREATNP